MTDRPDATSPGRLHGRLIGLGVTGSIAAYKAVELLRLLRAEGADVSVMLTPSATRFVGPLTFAALSNHPVETDLLALLPDERIGHIVIADAADAIVVAPATAHWLGAMAHGLAGDVVTATVTMTMANKVSASVKADLLEIDMARSSFKDTDAGVMTATSRTIDSAHGQFGADRTAGHTNVDHPACGIGRRNWHGVASVGHWIAAIIGIEPAYSASR